MYYINYHMTNHNVENYRIKRDHVPIVFEIATQHIKIHRPMRYSYHICGDIGHKIISIMTCRICLSIKE
jgi:hypothetical protein